MTSPFKLLSEHRCFGGMQRFLEHPSREIGLPMRFSIYLPPQAAIGKVPALMYLAGLTCNEETFMVKAGAQRMAADLGIAMATGTDLAKSAGDVLLMSNRLGAIPQTLELARRTLRIIRQNLFWAFAYNVAAIPLAMMGVLSPGVAAGAMMLSSLTVVLNALRLRRV